MIQATVILGVTKFSHYAKMLINRFIQPHFKNGVKQVHVIFDCHNTESDYESPKEIERKKRDMEHSVKPSHVHVVITEDEEIPSNWRDNIINCRDCKQNLCHFLGTYLLVSIQNILQQNQEFLTSGAFTDEKRNKCLSVKNGAYSVVPHLESNSEETDLRVWLHCKHAYGSKILIYSPDTDIYHIGLPLVDSLCDVYIQQRANTHEHARYLSLSNLIKAFTEDPDLAYIPQNKLPYIFQTLYVVSGCDYISFFKGIGKLFFMQIFYKYAKFISSGTDIPGTLDDITVDGLGFLSFIRLVGSAYFSKHRSGFSAVSPENLYYSYPSSQRMQMQERIYWKMWLSSGRKRVWPRLLMCKLHKIHT
jgi:DNA-directed RNA polymerase subunit M/transcription elongation factor TFIIS